MKNKLNAFSLVEMSIVLLVMSILMIGMADMGSFVIRKANIRATKDKLITISNAINSYVIENGKLPQPGGTVGSIGSLLEYGDINFDALNISEDLKKDLWNRNFVYVVDRRFTDSYPSTIPFFLRATNGAIAVDTIKDATSDAPGDLKVVYLVYSEGPNRTGDSLNNDLSDDNVENDANFEMYKIDENLIDENFDDIMIAKTRADIIAETGWEEVGCILEDSRVYSNPQCTSRTISGNDYLIFSNEKNEFETECDINNAPIYTCIIKCGKYGRSSLITRNPMSGESC